MKFFDFICSLEKLTKKYKKDKNNSLKFQIFYLKENFTIFH
jgi:hypothetical protein